MTSLPVVLPPEFIGLNDQHHNIGKNQRIRDDDDTAVCNHCKAQLLVLNDLHCCNLLRKLLIRFMTVKLEANKSTPLHTVKF